MNNVLDVYESLLLGISGVYGAKFRTNSNDEITECHILADNTRNVKQIVRDVQSALMAKYGVDLDYKLISVAQIDEPQEFKIEGHDNSGDDIVSRLAVKSIQYNNLISSIESTVVIGNSENTYTGTAGGTNSINAAKKIVARAAIDAINTYIGIDALLSIGDVISTDLSGKQTIIISVHCIYRNMDETYVGCALVDRDVNLAVVKATLNAINRRIVVLKSE